MKNRKGQGLSLNVIIIAALALIVLVVLVVIFTGRIGIFTQGVSKEGDAELVSMRIQYGDCHPTITGENDFKAAFAAAESDVAKESAKNAFRSVIASCGDVTEKVACETGNCKWN